MTNSSETSKKSKPESCSSIKPRFKLEKDFSEWLRKEEFPSIPASWWLKPWTGSRRGVPDWIGCVKGHFVSLELKRARAQAAPREKLQAYVAEQIHESGGLSWQRVDEFNWPEIKKELLKL